MSSLASLITLPGDPIQSEDSNESNTNSNTLSTATIISSKNDINNLNLTPPFYQPQIGHSVIGIILGQRRGGANSDICYKVDIGCGPGLTALLPSISFNGATRRNKPNLEVGDFVVGWICEIQNGNNGSSNNTSSISSVNLNGSVVLSCVDTDSSKSWTSKEVIYGALEKGGCIVRGFPVGKYSNKNSGTKNDNKTRINTLPHILDRLGKAGFKFESTVGDNNRIYIRATTPSTTLLLCRTVFERIKTQNLSDIEIEVLLKKVINESGVLASGLGTVGLNSDGTTMSNRKLKKQAKETARKMLEQKLKDDQDVELSSDGEAEKKNRMIKKMMKNEEGIGNSGSGNSGNSTTATMKTKKKKKKKSSINGTVGPVAGNTNTDSINKSVIKPSDTIKDTDSTAGAATKKAKKKKKTKK